MSYLLFIVSAISQTLQPVFAASATAAAIVLFTAAVRLALHPLSRAAVRGEKTRTKLAPEMSRLQRQYGHDRERFAREMNELYRTEGSTPVAGCLPLLLQLPVFFVMYQLFTTRSIGGEPNSLLTETLAGVPLGSHWADVMSTSALLGSAGIVYGALFLALGLVALWTYRRTRRMMAAQQSAPAGPAAALSRVMPWMSFGTVIVAAVVPLAAGLYLLTTTAWSVTERAWLQRTR